MRGNARVTLVDGGAVPPAPTFAVCIVGDIAAQTRNSLVGGPFGSDLVSKDYVPTGIPVIRGTNMGHGRWVDGEFVFVTPEKAKSLLANCASPGDIVFTQRGTLGQVALVPRNGVERYLISQSQMKLTVDAQKADTLFLYYVFVSPEQQGYIRQNSIQTGVPHTNLGILRNTPLRLPPLAEQKSIAHILGTLDDKIELNRRMNATLEATARAIFKSWFVDFDPVRAKAAGRVPVGMTPEVAALFPDGFEDSELGEIPIGWRAASAGDMVETVGGGTPDTKNATYWEPEKHFWTTPKDLSGLQAPILLSTERRLSQAGLKKVSSGLLPGGALLMSSRAPIGYLAITGALMAINQGYIAMLPGSRLPPLFMLRWCQENMETIKGHANGSTFMEISKKVFRSLPILVPSASVIDEFLAGTAPLFEQVVENEKQSRTLATLRDTLLPKLLAGEIRVDEAERNIEKML